MLDLYINLVVKCVSLAMIFYAWPEIIARYMRGWSQSRLERLGAACAAVAFLVCMRWLG